MEKHTITLGGVTDFNGSRKLIYRLYTCGKAWTDIVFGGGYERV